jgi:hypothetical protein
MMPRQGRLVEIGEGPSFFNDVVVVELGDRESTSERTQYGRVIESHPTTRT